VESQQPAVTRQWPVNNKRGIVFSAHLLPMAAKATMEYIMPSINNNYTATEERCFSVRSVPELYNELSSVR
jgi:hypothetical protein